MADAIPVNAVPINSPTGPVVRFNMATLQHPAFYILVGMALTITIIYAVKKGKL